MIIINADDYGRSQAETDAALSCYRERRISSVTAMVFMDDSRRAAALAKEADLDVGLHLNFSQQFTDTSIPGALRDSQSQIVRFLAANKYARLLYNPLLRRQFNYAYEHQMEGFLRLYGRAPSHIDGHRHLHLCSNMLLDRVIPEGEMVRRSFSFWPGDKGLINRSYRSAVDWLLARRYRVVDYFFALSACLRSGGMERPVELASSASVELMVHPALANESQCLMSDKFLVELQRVKRGTFRML